MAFGTHRRPLVVPVKDSAEYEIQRRWAGAYALTRFLRRFSFSFIRPFFLGVGSVSIDASVA